MKSSNRRAAFASLVLSCLAASHFAVPAAYAANAEPWTMRSGSDNGRFEGKTVSGRHASTKVDDDVLSVIKDEATGGGFLRFELNSNARLSEQYSYVFIYDGPKTSSSKRVRLRAPATITPDPDGTGGTIVLGLTASDIATLQSYDGNIMGVAYAVQEPGRSGLSDKSFLFLGKGIAAALADLGLDKPIKYAALAVQNSDGTFGYSFDHETREQAVAKASNECQQHGGDNCDTKLVLSGPACIAYHSDPDSNVYGWGFSTDQGAATSRASEECTKRNDNKVCRSTSWSCNTRMEAPVNVVFEAPNNSKAGGGVCHAVLSTYCNNFENIRNNGTLINGIYINAALKQPLDFEGCGTAGRSSLLLDYKRGGQMRKSEYGAGFTANEKAEVRKILERYRDVATSAYPACRPNSVKIDVSERKESVTWNLDKKYYKKIIDIDF